MMNREANGSRVKAAAELSIPFVCNIVEYMDPWILVEFNKLVQRYCPDINKSVVENIYVLMNMVLAIPALEGC